MKCNATGCDRIHHPLLHTDHILSAEEPHAHSEGTDQESHFLGLLRTSVANETMFRVVPVVVSANGCEQRTFAMLATGSTGSFIATGLARQLGLEGTREKMMAAWTDQVKHPIMTERVEISVVGANGIHRPVVVNMFDELSLPKQSVVEQQLIEEGLESMPIARILEATPQLLLGLDNAVLLEGTWKDTCLMTQEDRKRAQLVRENSLSHRVGLIVEEKDGERCVKVLCGPNGVEPNTDSVVGYHRSSLLWTAEGLVLPDNWTENAHTQWDSHKRRRREAISSQSERGITKENEGTCGIGQPTLSQSERKEGDLPIPNLNNRHSPEKDARAAESRGVSLQGTGQRGQPAARVLKDETVATVGPARQPAKGYKYEDRAGAAALQVEEVIEEPRNPEEQLTLVEVGAAGNEEVVKVSASSAILGSDWLTLTDALSFRWRERICDTLEGTSQRSGRQENIMR